jgi:hypothetical protein
MRHRIRQIRHIHQNPHIQFSAGDSIALTFSDLRLASRLLLTSVNDEPCEADVTCRIDRFPTSQGPVLRISGRITGEDLDILRTALEDGSVVAVELAELKSIDRDALKLLAIGEANGIELRHCPAYVREWMKQENS